MEPFASKYRPSKIEDFIGQKNLVGDNGIVKNLLKSGEIPSMIFWGPPGTGKTTLAYIISKSIDSNFYKLSAVTGVKSDLLKVVKKALQDQKENTLLKNKKTILFLDEIHRWSKSQQDALLPFVEKGIIILIGATTENPSFSLVPALLSRTRVFVFEKHSEVDILNYLNKLIQNLKFNGTSIKIKDEALDLIAKISDGDIRTSANILESSYLISKEKIITKEQIQQNAQKIFQYNTEEDHFNLISAVHKSLRDSDPSAGVYWILRMLRGGEDPLYIARRLIRFASEDIGNADPQALVLANSVFNTCKNIGLPECKTALVQLAQYLAKAPKDNSAFVAESKAEQDIDEFGTLPVPLHLRNAPTKLLKDLNYGKEYIYPHDLPNKKTQQKHLPEKLIDRDYFRQQS